jgi:phenylalanyl-tRNA synthetase alpha subunit
MRYPEAKKVDGYVAGESAMVGPAASPGTYQVRLMVGDHSYSESFIIHKDPRVSATQADLEAQFELQLKIRDKLSETHDAINMIRNMRRQIEDWMQRTQERQDHEAIVKAGESLKEKLTAIEDELVQSKAKSRQDTLNFPIKLNSRLANLAGVVASADAAPTRQAYELFADLVARIDVQLRRLQELIETDVAAFNGLMRESDVPALIPITTLAGNP